jgi:multidrug resistance efflux pump
MIEPKELRIVGHIAEDKGLADIKLGQKVVFTVDAFGSKEYSGVVSSISPTSRNSDIVFSISDKRQEQEFDVKVSYDVKSAPELKNGMSARMWIYK